MPLIDEYLYSQLFEIFIFAYFAPAFLVAFSLGLKLKYNKESVILVLFLAPLYTFIWHFHCGFYSYFYHPEDRIIFIINTLGTPITGLSVFYITSKLKRALFKRKN